MDSWMIAAIMIGSLLIVGIVVVGVVNAEEVEENIEPVCDNTCTPGNSCGKSECGVQKTGSCGCGR